MLESILFIIDFVSKPDQVLLSIIEKYNKLGLCLSFLIVLQKQANCRFVFNAFFCLVMHLFYNRTSISRRIS